MTNETAPPSIMKSAARHRVHWHIFLTHGPISLFGVCAAFQVLHLFLVPACLEIASNICLLGATLVLVPTTLTGWTTWKKQYKGFRSPVFLRKRTVSFLMLGLSIPLTIWRVFFLRIFENAPWSPAHWIYLSGTVLLIIGAILEGYFGATLHHQ